MNDRYIEKQQSMDDEEHKFNEWWYEQDQDEEWINECNKRIDEALFREQDTLEGWIDQQEIKKPDQPLKGIPLAYINARDVMERLDMIVGAENWQDRYPREGCCEIGIKLNGEWVWKSDGAGQTDVEGEKGQYSDAFKRAAVKWGIGRYLYDLPNEWVELTGNNWKPFVKEPKLPQWATPNGWGRVDIVIKREVYSQVVDHLANGDEHGICEVMSEFDSDEKAQLWGMFDSKQRQAIKDLQSS